MALNQLQRVVSFRPNMMSTVMQSVLRKNVSALPCTVTRAFTQQSGTVNVLVRKNGVAAACRRTAVGSQLRSMAKLPTGKPRQVTSPVGWISVAVILGVGGAALYYFTGVRNKMKDGIERRKSQVAGTPSIGGPFTLTGVDGKPYGSDDLKGKWSILYFGFTFCPDVCPDELNKLSEALEILETTKGVPEIQPVFISIDPERDTPKKIKEYLEDFHPRIVGLTGTPEEVKTVAKAYRIYYSKPIEDTSLDYLVDHTIVMYLIKPDGDFGWYYGQNTEAPEMAEKITQFIQENS